MLQRLDHPQKVHSRLITISVQLVRLFDAPQDMFCPFGCQGSLLTPIELTVNQHPQIPFYRAVLQLLLSQFILVPGISPFQVQNLALGLLKFHAIDNCPMFSYI